MKKFSWVICLFSFFFAACDKEELTRQEGTTEITFNLALQEPDYAPAIKASVTMGRYILEMYEGDLLATPVKKESNNGVFNVELKKDVDYVCLFWADGGATAYDATDLKAVKQTDATKPGTVGYCAKVTVNSKTFDGTVTLKRAVAELAFIDKDGLIEAKTLKITYPYASVTLNVDDGTVTSATGSTVHEVSGIVADKTEAFATDYVLAPTAAGSLAGLKFQLNGEVEKTIATTVIRANYRSRITGEYEEPMPSMNFTIDTRKNTDNASDKTFVLPLYGTLSNYLLIVDWGDGKTETFDKGTSLTEANMTHTYDQANEYTITIFSSQKDPSQAQMPLLNFNYNQSAVNKNPLKLISLNTPLLNMGTNFFRCFYGCTGLTGEIPATLFDKNTNVTDFSNCFYGCTGLTGEIPATLFDKNTNVTDFSNCFYGCSGLTGEIPVTLFDKNTNVTDFSKCFYGCSGLTGEIPATLFDKNTNVLDFFYCFGSCSGLTGGIPATLFDKNTKVTDFSYCFDGCSGLTGEIPATLFDKNTNVLAFSSCFGRCSGLTGGIPATLFDKHTKVLAFSHCFYNCSGLTGEIPVTLFEKNTEVINFSGCFRSCSKLTGGIPATLFDKHTNVTNFSNCFSGCSELTGKIPATLFEKSTNVTDFLNCFNGCSKLTGEIPATLFDKHTKVTTFCGCFYGCSGLTGEIPATLFEKNTNVTDFSYCFSNCSGLVLNANIFCDEATQKTTRFAGKEMDFSVCFNGCNTRNAGGTAPALWEYTMKSSKSTECFGGIGNLTNATSIPTEWK